MLSEIPDQMYSHALCLSIPLKTEIIILPKTQKVLLLKKHVDDRMEAFLDQPCKKEIIVSVIVVQLDSHSS